MPLRLLHRAHLLKQYDSPRKTVATAAVAAAGKVGQLSLTRSASTSIKRQLKLSKPKTKSQIPIANPSIPAFLLPFYDPSIPGISSLPPQSPAKPFSLPPAPSHADLAALSELHNLLSPSQVMPRTTHTYNAISDLYHALPPSLLSPAVHEEVLKMLSRSQIGRGAFERCIGVVHRMQVEGIEVNQVSLARALTLAYTPEEIQIAVQIGEEELKRSDEDDLRRKNEGRSTSFQQFRSRPVSGGSGTTTLPRGRDMLITSLLKFASGEAAGRLLTLSSTPQSNQHIAPLARMLSSTSSPNNNNNTSLVTSIPSLIPDPDNLTIQQLNALLFQYATQGTASLYTEVDEATKKVIVRTSREGVKGLDTAIEVYVALRRHAAGLKSWRREYVRQAASGIFNNPVPPHESLANPILDRLDYRFPSDLKPNRSTYSSLLNASIRQGQLALALRILRDMLDPNNTSLRLASNGPGWSAPELLEAFEPQVMEYIAIFNGFLRWGYFEAPRLTEPTADELAKRPPKTLQEYISAQDLARENSSSSSTSTNPITEVYSRPKVEPSLGYATPWTKGLNPDEITHSPRSSDQVPASYRASGAAVEFESTTFTLPTLVTLFKSFIVLSPPVPEVVTTSTALVPPEIKLLERHSHRAPTSRQVYAILQAFSVCSGDDVRLARDAWARMENKFAILPGRDEGVNGQNDEGWWGWEVDQVLADEVARIGGRIRTAGGSAFHDKGDGPKVHERQKWEERKQRKAAGGGE